MVAGALAPNAGTPALPIHRAPDFLSRPPHAAALRLRQPAAPCHVLSRPVAGQRVSRCHRLPIPGAGWRRVTKSARTVAVSAQPPTVWPSRPPVTRSRRRRPSAWLSARLHGLNRAVNHGGCRALTGANHVSDSSLHQQHAPVAQTDCSRSAGWPAAARCPFPPRRQRRAPQSAGPCSRTCRRPTG